MPTLSSQRSKSFAELFCERNEIPPTDYSRTVLRRSLYLRARVLGPLLRLIDRDYFAADFEFVSGVGNLRRLRDFEVEISEFMSHPSNHGILRSRCRLRVSVRRLRGLVAKTFGEVVSDNGGSIPPMGMR